MIKDAGLVFTNGKPGFLATDIAAKHPVPDEVLHVEAGTYYWHLRASPGSTKYKVVCRFASWLFPERIPTHWLRSRPSRYFGCPKGSMYKAVKGQDKSCIVTDYRTCGLSLPCPSQSSPTVGLLPALESAYLVPRAEKDWFYACHMYEHILSSTSGIDDVANGVALRADIRACLDRGGFVFYPCGEGKYLAYVVNELEDEYAALFHHRLVNMHARVPGELLYARFALAVINIVAHFDWDYPACSFPIPSTIAVLNGNTKRSATTGSHSGDSLDSEVAEGSDEDRGMSQSLQIWICGNR